MSTDPFAGIFDDFKGFEFEGNVDKLFESAFDLLEPVDTPFIDEFVSGTPKEGETSFFDRITEAAIGTIEKAPSFIETDTAKVDLSAGQMGLGGGVTAARTGAIPSVDLNKFEREWLARLSNFTKIKRETGSSI